MTTQLTQIIHSILEVDDHFNVYEVDNYTIYPQTWATTALGFNGWGGDVMTTAPTTAIEAAGKIYVLFGGRHAYSAKVTDISREVYNNIFYNRQAPSVKAFRELVKSKE